MANLDCFQPLVGVIDVAYETLGVSKPVYICDQFVADPVSDALHVASRIGGVMQERGGLLQVAERSHAQPRLPVIIRWVETTVTRVLLESLALFSNPRLLGAGHSVPPLLRHLLVTICEVSVCSKIMPIKPLRKYSSPDLSNFVIHFTGRGGKANDQVPTEIGSLSPKDRLLAILNEGRIRGFPIFGQNQSVVCFTEASPAGVSTLVREGRYQAWGIAFSKDVVFAQKGGPVLYVRGDELLDTYGLPEALRARVAKFWPGVEQGANEPIWQAHERTESEWTHEREWRVPLVGGRTDFVFTTSDIAFLLVPSWPDAPPGYPAVVVDGTGAIHDQNHHWV
jgi:hypothetical protein